MRLEVRITEFAGKRYVVLHDAESGDPLPGQVTSTLETGAGDMATVTVTFAVDERDVYLVPSKAD